MNIYETMKDSEQIDSDGNFYPDVCSFNLRHFRFSDTPVIVELTESAIDRFDLTIAEYYGIPDYTDIILWLNNYAIREDLYSDDIPYALVMPSLNDLENYYLRNTE
jgi:hypothetical protein